MQRQVARRAADEHGVAALRPYPGIFLFIEDRERQRFHAHGDGLVLTGIQGQPLPAGETAEMFAAVRGQRHVELGNLRAAALAGVGHREGRRPRLCIDVKVAVIEGRIRQPVAKGKQRLLVFGVEPFEIGRASCRERVYGLV